MAEYIEKQAAVEAIESVPAGNWSSKRYARELEKIQPADVRPVVRGKWIVKTDSEGKVYGVCSCCWYKQYAGHLKYCPECGGKMDGHNQ